MIALRAHAQGVIVPVRAQPGARRSGVTGEHNGMLKVSVTAAPDKGKANQAIIAVLADELSLPHSRVELLSGGTSRSKQFLVRDASLQELASRVAELVARL